VTDIDLLISFRELVHLYLKILRTDLHINMPQELIMRKVYGIPINIAKEVERNPRKIRIIKQIINSIVDINQVSNVEIESLREWLKDPPRRPVKRS